MSCVVLELYVSLRFNFQASNNEAEYEALLASICMRKAAGAMKIDGYSDSHLVRSQYHGDYKAMRPAMIKYLQVVKDEAGTLDEFHLSQVPSSENNQADALSKLSSSASCDAPRSVFWEVMEKRSIEHDPIEILHQSSTWMDSMGTGIFVMEGTASADGKTITLKGSHPEPGGGQMTHRAVWKIVDNNTQTFDMYGTHGHGKEMKMMEITYTRKQG